MSKTAEATMTTRQADRAIKSGQAIEVQSLHGDRFKLTIRSRNRRVVYGVAEADGKKDDDAAFLRSDLRVIG